MSEQTLQQRIAGLEAQLAQLQAKEDIRNLMGRYQSELSRGLSQRLYTDFWSGRGDNSLEVGASGAYRGDWNAAAYYQKDVLSGVFQVHILGEPEIELAPDGMTAAGIWQGIGVDLDAGEYAQDGEPNPERSKLWTSAGPDGRRYRSEWLIRRLCVELIREEAGWRFWHVQVYELLRSPMDSDFVAWAEQRFQTDGPRLDELFRSNQPFAPDRPPERMADEPTSNHWQYTWQSRADQLPR